MNFKRIFDLLEGSVPQPRMHAGIMDFVLPDCPHKKIGEAYDKASKMYDDYIQGKNIFLKVLKKIALGLGKEATEECTNIVKTMLEQVKTGIVLDVPAGTGVFAFEEYVKYPKILVIAAEYSWGMLRQAQKRVKELNAQNIILIRADVANLPFKDGVFDAVLSLNGIHSFPEKEKAIFEMSRVLKQGKKLHGSLILRQERWLTDLMLEIAYYRLLWFTWPALTRQELFAMFERNGLKMAEARFLKAAMAFEAVKVATPDTSSPAPPN